MARRIPSTRALLAFVLAIVLSSAACTNGRPQPPASASAGLAPSATPSPVTSSAPELALDVVADLSPQSSDHVYLDGMQLAAEEVNAAGGVAGRRLVLSKRDDRSSVSQATSVLRSDLQKGAVALLYVGPGTAITQLRSEFDRTGTPIVLLGGDLYTSDQLFREVFQTTIPWAWQSHDIGRYLVKDRRASRVAFIGIGPEARTAAAVTRGSLAYWGGRLATSVVQSQPSVDAAVSKVRSADAVVLYGSPDDSARMIAALSQLPHPPRIAGSAALLDRSLAAMSAPPGTTACYSYTWAGWAQPIKRVGAFRGAFERALGHDPVGLEQEGYDAVRTLAVALATTRARGGPALVRALEGVHATFSSFPVDLGPDDHTFLPRDELGLFAVAGPTERLDPWQQPGVEAWRALMRTFTHDGKRTDVADIDRRVFFPFWRKYLPGPEYWRSRYGITTRPSQDPVH